MPSNKTVKAESMNAKSACINIEFNRCDNVYIWRVIRTYKGGSAQPIKFLEPELPALLLDFTSMWKQAGKLYLVDGFLHLYQAQVGQGGLDEVHYRLQIVVLQDERLVAAQETQCNFENDLGPLQEQHVWNNNHTLNKGISTLHNWVHTIVTCTPGFFGVIYLLKCHCFWVRGRFLH